jgi:hypothetical protein
MIEYWFDRFVLSPLLPAAVLLALVPALPINEPGYVLTVWIYNLPLSLLLIAQFRLWDDLADRERDRQEHPERVLAYSEPAPFVIAAAMLSGLNLAIAFVSRGTRAGLILLALDVCLASYYRYRPGRRTAVSDALLLLKYPAIVVVLTQLRSDRWAIVLATIATYATVLAYEIWHDATSPLRINLS